MRRTNRGDDTDRGLGERRECRDVTDDVHTHLEDGYLVLGAQPQERQWQADLVVLVALVAQHLPAGREHLGDLLLGGRLGNRSGDADDERVEPRAPGVGGSSQRHAWVVDGNDGYAG